MKIIYFLLKLLSKIINFRSTKTEKNLVGKKTFFPAHWSREKVISKITEAYEEFLKTEENGAKRLNGNYIIAGIIDEGVVIRMHIDTEKALIINAYPILE